MYAVLENLSNAYGVSGHESQVRHIISRMIKPHVDSMYIDGMGNLICRQKGSGPKVMLAAHMDEIGLCIKEIDEFGHVYFSLVGGISEDALIGQRVAFQLDSGSLEGVITHSGLHDDLRKAKFPNYTEMYIDTGLSRKELEKKGVHVGTFVVPDAKLRALGNQKVVSGKALDDRIGCTVLLELARKMKAKKRSIDLYYVFTVQEEVGLYGAKTAIYQVDPDWGIAVDTTSAEDSKSSSKGIGFGPSLTVKDAQMIANPFMLDNMVKKAKSRQIPFQYEVSDEGTTDALSMSLSKGGVPTTVLAVPIRNIHSTISIAHMDDLENSVRLLESVLTDPPKVMHKRKYDFFR